MYASIQWVLLRKLSLDQSMHVETNDEPTFDDIHEDAECSRYLNKIFLQNKFLTHLNLRHLSVVLDASLHCLPRGLTHVDLGGCGHVTDVGVRRLSLRCPHLVSLSLSKTKITDRSLTSLATSRCKASLREIRVNGCLFITDDGIQVFKSLFNAW